MIKEAKPDLEKSDKGKALQALELCKKQEVGKMIIKISRNTSIVVSPEKANSKYIEKVRKRYNV